ncbi:MAG: hypothetical protein HY096_10760 [Nitrospinae bacterium]|nr:hypothetical protein [Nitrospinota bacterium]
MKFFDDAIRLNRNLIVAYSKRKEAVKERNQEDGLFSDGMERFKAGKLRDALPIFQQCKTHDPYHPKIDEVLKLTEENIQSAKKSFEEAEKFRGMKNWSEAGKLYSKTLKLDSEYPDVASRQEEVVREEKTGQQLFDEGSSHFVGKKLTSALNLFKQCKEQSPYHSLVNNALNDTEERLKKIAALHNEAEVSIKKHKHGNTIATLENLLDIYPLSL